MQINDGGNAPVQPVQVGQDYPVENLADSSGGFQLHCEEVAQRNWSRVGVGRINAQQGDLAGKYFLKQNINKAGLGLPAHWVNERTGTLVGQYMLENAVDIPALVFHMPSLLLNVFEYANVVPLDEILRDNSEVFRKHFPDILPQLVQVLEELQVGDVASLPFDLPVKERDYGGPSSAVNFKGFDIRNMAVRKLENNRYRWDRLVMFDFGKPYLAPIEEAAAKLFVSIGLLNWGRPVSRFALGPDEALLEKVLPSFRPFLDIKAVRTELQLQAGFRSREFHGAGGIERNLKRWGVGLLGKRYLSRLARWCNKHIT